MYIRETGATLTIPCTAVILATGGYSTDHHGLLKEYTPHLMSLPSTNAQWRSVGQGVRVAAKLGAQLQLMDAVQIHPTGLVDPKNPTASFVILAGIDPVSLIYFFSHNPP